MFSKSCEYALQAVLFIAQHSKTKSKIVLKDIAEAQGIPLHFLSKILQLLVKHNILKSTRGRGGGFRLSNDLGKINLLEVVQIVEGNDIFDTCTIGLRECNEVHPCPLHNEYKIIKDKFISMLSGKTLLEFCNDLDSRKSFLGKDSNTELL
jgi:Rrf2 family protein